MWKKKPSSSSSCRFVLLACLCLLVVQTEGSVSATLVKKEGRRILVSTENGEISAVRIDDEINGPYILNFFTLDPNSLLLPLILHQDMVFYVHTGSGKLSWTEDGDLKETDLRRGDVGRVEEGSVFYIQSNLETERNKLRIFTIFSNSNHAALQEPDLCPYSSIRDALLGFDRKLLQAALGVTEEVIDEMSGGMRPPAIVHAPTETKRTERVWEMDEVGFLTSFLGIRNYKNGFQLNKKKKGSGGLFNIWDEGKDFENIKGWSTTVTRKKLSALKSTNIGLFMVNLTAGSMMGPHWNPTASEIAVVVEGRGIVDVVGSGLSSNETGAGGSSRNRNRKMRFEVEEGDVFAVPKFDSMAQIAFNNGIFVFMGFATCAKKNHPQFLAGKASVFRTLDKDVLAMSFNTTNTTTLGQIFDQQKESVILGCTSCAEEEWRVMHEEEEARRKEEEKKRREEEEEAAREEEERRRREEEEAKQREREREEEAARKKEEEAAREEEERRRREEEEHREEEEQREREEEAARKKEEEAARRHEHEKRKREEEEKRREQRQAEEERRREIEEEARRREEEESARRQEEQKRSREEEEEHGGRRERRQDHGRSEEERAAEQERRWEEEMQREEETAGEE